MSQHRKSEPEPGDDTVAIDAREAVEAPAATAEPRRRGARLLAITAAAAGLVAVVSLAALAHPATTKPTTTTLDSSSKHVAAAGGTSSGKTADSTGGGNGAAAQPAAASAYQVAIKGYAFSPKALTVAVGDTVTWTNEDSAPHTVTVTSGPEKFDSGTLQQGESFSYTFTKAGTYDYYCAVHPDMTASVTVRSAASPSPTVAPSSPAPTASSSPTTAPTTGGECGALYTSVNVFLQHVYAAHLEESPGQQVGDILNVDQYIQMHTTLIVTMIEPQVSALTSASQETLTIFLEHVYAAHLEESPSQQVGDILDLDKYIQMHTTLIANMVKPLGNAELGSC